jgi:hypothetical protein
MENKNINEFLNEYRIEEKIPYFGRARLYTIPLQYQKKFIIPREVFHFITAIYIIDSEPNNKYQLRLNSSYTKYIDESLFSDISRETNKRNNIIEDPLFLGMNSEIVLECIENKRENHCVNFLIEYAKISPDIYNQLHSNNICLVSKQDSKEIFLFRGNCL